MRLSPTENVLLALNESLSPSGRDDTEGMLASLRYARLAQPDSWWSCYMEGILLLSLARFHDAVPALR